MKYANSAEMRLAASKQAVQLPSEEEGGKPAHDEDFKAGFAAGKAAYAKNDQVSSADAKKAYKRLSNKHGSWWVDGYGAAIDLARGAYATKPAQIAKKMKLAFGRRPDPAKMDPDAAIEMAEAIANEIARKAKDALEYAHGEIRDQQDRMKAIDRAWREWDWELLVDLNLLSKEDYEFVTEVHGMYSW